ncbi:MAG TPA: hypothetical protein VGO33_08830 [Gemmatimonadaceae bacterium]|jgi:hypothetical protein|nr:hypothetical protein [Gemmatimonadaceae bacterium]
MTHTNGEGVLFVALLAALAACADPVTSTVGLGVSQNARSEPTPSSPTEERAALSKIARLVAVAMDNEPARQHLKRDMRAAPFREHKLELAPYLRSKDGKALLGRMAKANGGTETELLSVLAGIRRLEFYMPVAAQRESWTGSADVLVVSQLSEAEPIVAFDRNGAEVALDRSVAPTQPTLSIVPLETRFDHPMPALASKNARDRNGDAIGTLEPIKRASSNLIACDPCGGGGGVSAAIEPGIYLEYSRLLDMKEPWFRGDPEIEVHIHGPTSQLAPNYGENITCSGEHAPIPSKVFDQNTGFWQGRVLLFSATETAAFISKFQQGFHVLFWEDDNVPCELKLDTNVMTEILKSTAAAFSTVALKVLPGASPQIVAGVFLATFFSTAGPWLQTNDDFLGAAVDQASAGYYYAGNTHVIMDGTTLNGRATIVYRQ